MYQFILRHENVFDAEIPPNLVNDYCIVREILDGEGEEDNFEEMLPRMGFRY